MTQPTTPPATLVFRLPRSAYLAVLFLIFCVAPIAFAANLGEDEGEVGASWRLVFLVIPVLAAVFIARTATFVSSEGLRVRAAFGSYSLPWSSVRGISVSERSVYAVQDDGAVRLPCVRTGDLAAIAKVSGGWLPPVAEPKRKYAPSRRSRRG